MEVESDEVPQLQRCACHGVLAVLLDVGHDVYDVIHRAVLCAHGVLKGREGDGTAVEGQALEGRAPFFFVAANRRVLAGCEVAPVLLGTLLAHAC